MAHPGRIGLRPSSSRLAYAVALALASAAPGHVFAQAAPAPAAPAGAESAAPPLDPATTETEIENIVVTGFRASLELSLDLKKETAASVDTILAEDIAKFPDLNLAEAVQRIPGVAIARDAGEGRQITVRGLGPQFTRVRINGMEALSTAGGTDATGGTNRSRAFDFNVFASELFGSIAVQKTASASVEEGSLGATVDLASAHPFDSRKDQFVTALKVGYNDLSGDVDPRFTVLGSKLFMDGTVGALFSLAYTERNLVDDGSSTVRWQNTGFGPLDPTYKGPYTLAEINNAFHPRIPRYDHYVNDQTRLGVTGSLQWQPTSATLVSFDVLYSKLDGTREEYFLEAPTFSAGGAAGLLDTNVVEANIKQNGPVTTLDYGLFNDVDIRTEARFDKLSTEFTQFSLDGSHDFENGIRLHGIAGYAESNHDNPKQTTLLFDSNNIDGYSYDYRGSKNRLPLITYGTTNVLDPTIWTLTQIRLRPQTADNSFTNFAGDLAWEINESMTLSGGVQWKEYEFDTTERRRSNGTTANLEGVIPADAKATPIANYDKNVRLQHLGMPSGSINKWLVPDLRTAASLFQLYNESIYPLGIEPALGNNQSVDEQDTGVWTQLDFRFEMFGLPFRGNVGLRWVQTDQSSTGYTYVGTAAEKTTVDTDYDDWLPSANLVADVTDEFLVRLSASQVLTRAPLGNLAPSTSISVSGNNRTVTTGNPYLEPFKADAYDLSFEYYFAKQSLLSLALFYKDISSYISTTRDTRPFANNPYGLPDELGIAACGTIAGCTIFADWIFSVPTNTPGGNLQGLEASYQQPFSFLPGIWQNFGVILNYTYTDSKVDYLNPDGTVAIRTDLIGLSKSSYNATLYYEDDRLTARVAASGRDDYLTTVPGRNGNNVEGTASTLNVDFSMSWKANDNITFTLEGLNLTDEFQDQWVDSHADRLSYYHHTGRQYFLGMRYQY
jgi:TonB-dependent receptor